MNDLKTSLRAPTADPADSLSQLFLVALPEQRRAGFAQDAALEETLRRLLADARLLAPLLASEAFLAFVAQSLSSQASGGGDLASLRLQDLLLVFGYGRGDPTASEVIESQYLPQVERSLRSYALSDFDRAEIKQTLRQRLWASHVPQPGMAPYSGRGELLGWLRVTALREAGHMVRRGRGKVEVCEQETIEAGHIADSMELQLLKAQYREEFRKAFDAAMATLSSRERNLLRYTYIDSLSVDEIATIYKVHRATVARWVGQTRETLQKKTRQNLMQQCSLAGVDLDDILPLIWSQIDVSIRHHLSAHAD